MAFFNRILITGAAGRLGSRLRSGLTHLADRVRLSDRVDMGPAAKHEEIFQCELGDYDAVMEMTQDVDAIVHLYTDGIGYKAIPPSNGSSSPSAKGS